MVETHESQQGPGASSQDLGAPPDPTVSWPACPPGPGHAQALRSLRRSGPAHRLWNQESLEFGPSHTTSCTRSRGPSLPGLLICEAVPTTRRLQEQTK